MRYITRAMAAAALSASALHAQAVRGVVADRTHRPVSAVVVVLLDSADQVVGRALTGDAGEYRLLAPRAGTYRLRAQRIGFQPVLTTPRVLAAGRVDEEAITLDGVRVTLDAVQVAARSSCGRSSADAGPVLAAWDQAMTAVAATSLTASGRGLMATTRLVDRTLDPTGRLVVDERATLRTDPVAQPWRSLAPDTLRLRGYTHLELDDAVTFYAPGLDVLTAPMFLEDHCVRVVAAPDSAEIGLAFDPTPARSKLSEIRGTLWLHRATAELRRLEYTYTNPPGPAASQLTRAQAAGGRMTFTRLPTGAFTIASWDIRMPQLVKDSPRAPRARVASLQVTGGELVVLRRGADTLYRRPESTAAVVASSVEPATTRIPDSTTRVTGRLPDPPMVETRVVEALHTEPPRVEVPPATTSPLPPTPPTVPGDTTATRLRPVTVVAPHLDMGMDDFAANRRVGQGHFLTREDLAHQEGRPMSSVLATLAGVGIVSGTGGRGWILSRRYVVPLRAARECGLGSEPGGTMYRPSGWEQAQGMPCACYAQVYLDATLMNQGTPSEPFDVNSLSTTQIEAIEWYASPSETPAKYARLGSPCGVYVIHTRRPE